MNWLDDIHIGDCRKLMRQMIADGVKVQCIVTSPPYWGLRDYDVEGQYGMERSWVRHIARLRSTFRLARTLLADDGLFWLNYGDSYCSYRANGGIGVNSTINGQRGQEEFRKASRAMKSRISPPDVDGPNRRTQWMLKDKDMVGMPWMLALALRFDGWWLRSDCIWHKPNPMPESIRDRPTKSHEYVFLFSKSRRYYYDQAATREPVAPSTLARMSSNIAEQAGSARANGGTRPDRPMHPVVRHVPGQPKTRPSGKEEWREQHGRQHKKFPAGWSNADDDHQTINHARKQDAGQQMKGDRMTGFNDRWRDRKFATRESAEKADPSELPDDRNMRTVWSIPTEAFDGAHFATFPRELVRRCILSATRPGDVVFDPFMGSGTTAEVAMSLGRRFIGCELNEESAKLFRSHRSSQVGLPL